MLRSHAYRVLALIALGALAACAAASEREAGILGPYFFVCDDGSLLTVRFDYSDRTARVLVAGRAPHVLTQTTSASGYWYTDGPRSLRGRGRDALWQEAGGPAVTCRQRGG